MPFKYLAHLPNIYDCVDLFKCEMAFKEKNIKTLHCDDDILNEIGSFL